MRSLIAVIVLMLCVGTAYAEPTQTDVLKKSFPSIRGDDAQRVPHMAPMPTMPHHPMPPRIYPHYPDMGPGEFYYDGWGHPYRPYIRPYGGQPHRHVIPRRRDPRWSPWPEHNQNPHGHGGHGKGPLFRYYYGPNGWGFRIGPNITR